MMALACDSLVGSSLTECVPDGRSWKQPRSCYKHPFDSALGRDTLHAREYCIIDIRCKTRSSFLVKYY